MFVGRTSERKTLEDIYASGRSGLVILYGRLGMGKTALISEFIKDKNAFYYLCRDCTVREQVFSMQSELETVYGSKQEFPDDADLSTIFDFIVSPENPERRNIIILDEFHLCMKESALSTALLSILTNRERYGNVMFILSDSSVNWVENEMVGELAAAAKYIVKFMKLKELTFMELGQWFPRLSVEECIAINAVVGGVPAYLELWDERKAAPANIKRLFLSENAPLYKEAENVLRTELRELSAYNTILASLAAGRYKLNDIYVRTGFSRAKISVYIKNLIKLDVVEKVFSADSGNSDNAQKGLYRIRDNFLNFWYCFVFPNRSLISLGQGDRVLEENIKDSFKIYQRESFSDLCLEYLKLMSRHKRLKSEYDRWGSWYGKIGRIDILAADADGKILAAICNWGDSRPNEALLAEISDLTANAGVRPLEIFLFTQKSISAEAKLAYQKQNLVKVVELKDL